MKIPGVYELRFKTELMSPEKPFVICGAGAYEMGMLQRIESIRGGQYMICLLEKDCNDIWGIPVISLDDLLKMEKDTLIIISMLYAPNELYRILSKNSFTNIYSESEMPTLNPYIEEREDVSFSKRMIDKNKNDIEMVRSLLADDRSKQIFDTRLHAFQTDEWEKLEALWEPDQYFSKDIVRLEKGKEVFVDCGSYDFKNSMEFIFKTGNDYKRIYAFEMYAPFIRTIELLVEGYDLKNVSLFSTALGSKKIKAMQDVSFAGTCAAITLDGTVPCQMDSLDNLLYDLPDRPTFIKMDIEGMDAHGVKGAKKIIQRDKPKLAISVYHLLEHLWQIPLMIHKFEPSYKLYMRQHSRSICETVCYAVAD